MAKKKEWTGICRRCNEYKPVDDFPTDTARHHGRRTICRVCTNKTNKASRDRRAAGVLEVDEMDRRKSLIALSGPKRPVLPSKFGEIMRKAHPSVPADYYAQRMIDLAMDGYVDASIGPDGQHHYSVKLPQSFAFSLMRPQPNARL